MARTYQMKHNPQGTIYSLLTVESDGRMTMTFHGTDREICHEANVTEDGRITTGGSLFPGLASGRWNKMDDVRGLMADVVETTEPAEQAVVEETTNCTNYTNNEPVIVADDCNATLSEREPLTVNQPCPRRQRKPRKPRVERQEPLTVNLEPLTVNRQTSDTMKAIGMVAAATVAMFVIYETGLLIPLGLIGLATGGLLK